MQDLVEATDKLTTQVLNEGNKESETSLGMPEDQDQNFDMVRVKYTNLDNITFVLFT